MGDGVQERIEKNNKIFRDANEQIRAKVDELEVDIERVPFLCECPRDDCTDLVPMTLTEYSSVRSDGSHYFTLPEHASAERPVGTVIQRQDGYVVVEKNTGASES
jgi:hypothetical protein